jgi:hypothetical protein
MRRGLVVVSLATLAGLSLVAAAPAIGPTRSPLGNEEFTLAGVCPFELDVTPVADREILKEFPDGRLAVNGRLLVRVTNLESGASRVVNASGPATFTFREDSLLIRSRGRGLVVLFPGELGPGSGGGVLLTDGLVVQVFDGEGLHVLRLPHTRRNLCRELAQ